MDYQETKCFEIFRACVDAIHDGELIKQVSRGDKELGISTTTLWRKMNKYGIESKYGVTGYEDSNCD